jgi:hypothetical protein
MLIGWLAVVVFGALLALAANGMPRLWRSDSTYWAQPAAWWPWGTSSWRGWVRAVPVFLVGAAAMLIGAVPAVIGLPDPEDTSTRADVFFVWVVGAIAVMAASFALVLSIILFNRPRLFVPPARRNERGAWSRGNRAD